MKPFSCTDTAVKPFYCADTTGKRCYCTNTAVIMFFSSGVELEGTLPILQEQNQEVTTVVQFLVFTIRVQGFVGQTRGQLTSSPSCYSCAAMDVSSSVDATSWAAIAPPRPLVSYRDHICRSPDPCSSNTYHRNRCCHLQPYYHSARIQEWYTVILLMHRGR